MIVPHPCYPVRRKVLLHAEAQATPARVSRQTRKRTSPGKSELTVPEIQAIFNIIDRDGDGRVSRMELRSMVQQNPIVAAFLGTDQPNVADGQFTQTSYWEEALLAAFASLDEAIECVKQESDDLSINCSWNGSSPSSSTRATRSYS